MSILKLQGNESGTGIVTIGAPNTNTDQTINIPDGAGSFVTADSSGNVGIGTSNPTAALEVQSASNPEISIASTSGATDNLLNFKATSHSQPVQVQLKSSDNGDYTADLIFSFKGTGSSGTLTELMRIESSGNVGIGTSSPRIPLDIYGAGATTGGVTSHVVVSDSASYAADVGGRLTFEGKYNTAGNPASWASVAGLKENATDGNYAGYLSFSTRANGANQAERMIIDSSGNVGIGTSSPQYTTQITSTSANAVTNILALHNGSNAAGTGTGARLLFKLANFENAIESRKYASIEGISTSSYNEAIDLVFKTQPHASGGDVQERMRIDSNGRVTMPYQPAFFAGDPNTTFTPSSAPYVYSETYNNVGNHYNTSNGRFTAPVAGTYYFFHQSSARSTSSNTYEVKLYKNGGIELARVFNNGAGYGHGAMAVAIVNLATNDYIQAGFYNGSSVVMSGSSDLTGGTRYGIASGWGGYLIG